MKSHLAVAVAFFLGTALPQDGGDDEESLRETVAAQEEELDRVAADLAKVQATLDETVAYLRARSEQADGMMKVLDQAEVEGFTKGINWKSRETLLLGWRKLLGSQGEGLPKPAPQVPGKK